MTSSAAGFAYKVEYAGGDTDFKLSGKTDEEIGGQMMAQRHIELAQSAASSLDMAVEAIEGGLSLDTAAIDICLAIASLSEITGENATEEVIDRVFSQFCVGK